MRRAFVVGRRRGRAVTLVLIDSDASGLRGPFALRAVVGSAAA